MSMMVFFVLFFFPRGVLDEILTLIESVSEWFPSYFPILAVSTLMYQGTLAGEASLLNLFCLSFLNE